jgi:hypothetical protein
VFSTLLEYRTMDKVQKRSSSVCHTASSERFNSFIHQCLYIPLLGCGSFLRFVILYTVCRAPSTGDEPVARPLPIQRTAHKQNKRTQTSIPGVGFEPTAPVLERAATVIGLSEHFIILFLICSVYRSFHQAAFQ